MLRIAVRVVGVWLTVFGAGVWMVLLAYPGAGPTPTFSIFDFMQKKISTVKLNSRPADGSKLDLAVHLYGSDGWFDTGISVIPGTRVWISCPSGNGWSADCAPFAQAKVGRSSVVWVQPTRFEAGKPRGGKPLVMRTSSEQTPAGEETLVVGEKEQTLKLKLVPPTNYPIPRSDWRP